MTTILGCIAAYFALAYLGSKLFPRAEVVNSSDPRLRA
jgi:hypothetical protein